jgi:hypothetical protein
MSKRNISLSDKTIDKIKKAEFECKALSVFIKKVAEKKDIKNHNSNKSVYILDHLMREYIKEYQKHHTKLIELKKMGFTSAIKTRVSNFIGKVTRRTTHRIIMLSQNFSSKSIKENLDTLNKERAKLDDALKRLTIKFDANEELIDNALNIILESNDINGNIPTVMLNRIKDNIRILDEINEKEASIKEITKKIKKAEKKTKKQNVAIGDTEHSAPASSAVPINEHNTTEHPTNEEQLKMNKYKIYMDAYGYETLLRRFENREKTNFGRSRAQTIGGGKTTQRNRRYKTNAKAPFHYRRDRTKRRYRH